MNFSINVNEIQKQRQKDEMEKAFSNNYQNSSTYTIISQEVNEILNQLKPIQTINPENIISADKLITELFQKMSTLEFIPTFFIDENFFCDILMHYLSPPFSNHISCIIHDIFRLIYVSSEENALIVYNSSYFNQVCNYYYEITFNTNDPSEKKEKEDLFHRVIHSLRFGIHFFSFNELFFRDGYKERFYYLIHDCNFSEPVIHELLCLTDTMMSTNPIGDVASFITPILMTYFLDPRYTKICCDAFNRCTRFSYLYNSLFNVFYKTPKNSDGKECSNLLHSVLMVLTSQNQTYDIKAQIKSFILLSHILCFYKENSSDFKSGQLTVQIVTVDFCNTIIVKLLNPEVIKPKHLEMVLNSILQISLNDASIPSIICQSYIFQTILNLIDNPKISYFVGISCRLLLASLLRAEDQKLALFVFDKSFLFLEDLLISDEPAWIIEGLDAILTFLTNLSKFGNTDIILKIKNEDTYSWVHECLDECKQSSVERIAQSALNSLFILNEQQNTNE